MGEPNPSDEQTIVPSAGLSITVVSLVSGALGILQKEYYRNQNCHPSIKKTNDNIKIIVFALYLLYKDVSIVSQDTNQIKNNYWGTL